MNITKPPTVQVKGGKHPHDTVTITMNIEGIDKFDDLVHEFCESGDNVHRMKVFDENGEEYTFELVYDNS